jgi:hypothetical protein
MAKVGNLYVKLGGYFKYFFIMAEVGDLFINYNRFNDYYRR